MRAIEFQHRHPLMVTVIITNEQGLLKATSKILTRSSFMLTKCSIRNKIASKTQAIPLMVLTLIINFPLLLLKERQAQLRLLQKARKSQEKSRDYQRPTKQSRKDIKQRCAETGSSQATVNLHKRYVWTFLNIMILIYEAYVIRCILNG